MAALMRSVGPSVARYFDPGPDDLIDTFFDGTPMPVTIEVFPFAPARRITDQKLSINLPFQNALPIALWLLAGAG